MINSWTWETAVIGLPTKAANPQANIDYISLTKTNMDSQIKRMMYLCGKQKKKDFFSPKKVLDC